MRITTHRKPTSVKECHREPQNVDRHARLPAIPGLFPAPDCGELEGAALLAGRENNPAWNRAGPERSSERTAEAGMERSDIGRPGAAGDVTGAEPPSTIAALLAGRENNPAWN